MGVRAKVGRDHHFSAGFEAKRMRDLQFVAVGVAGAGKHLLGELAIRGDNSVNASAVWAAVVLLGCYDLEALSAQGARPQIYWDRACIS